MIGWGTDQGVGVVDVRFVAVAVAGIVTLCGSTLFASGLFLGTATHGQKSTLLCSFVLAAPNFALQGALSSLWLWLRQ